MMPSAACFVPVILVAMAATVLFVLHMRIDGPTEAPARVPVPSRPRTVRSRPLQTPAAQGCIPDEDIFPGGAFDPVPLDEYDAADESMDAMTIKRHAAAHLDRYGNPPLNAERLYGRIEPRGTLHKASPTPCGKHWDIVDGNWCHKCSARDASGALDIAWAVSLMSEGSYIDGAAVLAKSIAETHGYGRSEHRHHLVAFATRNGDAYFAG